MPDLRGIMLIVLAAALANVAIAWTAALSAPAPSFDPQATAALRREQEDVHGVLGGDVWIEGVWRGALVTTTITKISVDGEPRRTFDHGFGWPMRCLSGQEHAAGRPARKSWSRGFPLDSRFDLLHPLVSPPSPMYRLSRIVPIGPRVPGLVLNTAAYAACALALLVGSRSARAFVRRARHRCPACGYRLVSRSDGCSECGWHHARA